MFNSKTRKNALLNRLRFIIQLSSLIILSAPAAIAGQSATAELLGRGVEPGVTEPTTELVSIMPDGSQLRGDSILSLSAPKSFSADGRFVVFEGRPSGNSSPSVFRRDLVTGTTDPVSVDLDGNLVSSRDEFAITADGRHVVFRANPHSGGGRGFYMRDMDAGVTEFIVLPTTDGEDVNSLLNNLDISADARFLAFKSSADNLLPLPDPDCLCNRLFVYDRESDTIERVNVASDGTVADAVHARPVLSADGRFVAFYSEANLVPDDTNDEGDVYVRDRSNGTTERVSVASDGTEGNDWSGSVGDASRSSISADGRFVAFVSQASNLVPDDTNGWRDVFVHDRNTGTTERVSVASDGAEGNHTSTTPMISPDGRFVSFKSNAALVPDDTNGGQDIYIHDRTTGSTERVSLAHDGAQLMGVDNRNAISPDGRFVAFQTHRPGVVPEDNDNARDVFVRDRGGPTTVDPIFEDRFDSE